MRIGILGGGFGVYGYAPATHFLKHQIVTLVKYKNVFSARSELSHLLDSIIFLDDEESIFEHSDAVVIARVPTSVSSLEKLIECYPGHLFLEKPLGATWHQQESNLRLLKSRVGSFSVGYLSSFTPWYHEILNQFQKNQCEITINWRLTPPRDSWKVETELGGGIFSYYAIHFFELLLDCEMDLNSETNYENSSTHFELQASNKTSAIKISVDLSSENRFTVGLKNPHGDKIIYEAESPFGRRGKRGESDPRVTLLSMYIKDNLFNPDSERYIEIEDSILRFRQKFSNNSEMR